MSRAAVTVHRTASAVLLCACVAGATKADLRAEPPPIVVRVYNMTSSAPTVRREAMDVAAGILAHAGLSVDWRDCSPDADRERCRQGRRADDRTVRVVSELVPSSRPAGSGVTAVATDDGVHLGFAALDFTTQRGVLATVYHNRVDALAARLRLNYAALLGRAIAHEVGHLLLGRAQHGASGLMRAVWTDDELARNHALDWVVAPADGQRMRRATVKTETRSRTAVSTF